MVPAATVCRRRTNLSTKNGATFAMYSSVGFTAYRPKSEACQAQASAGGLE